MKRAFCLTAALLLISACTQQRLERLPPEEVLQRAAFASAGLQSAQWNAEGTFALTRLYGGQTEGSFHIDGILQGGGEQVQAAIAADVRDVQTGEQGSIAADVIVADDDEVYFRITNAIGVDSLPFPGPATLSDLGSGWWFVPGSWSSDPEEQPTGAQGPPMRVAPDPALLQLQARVVRVVRERGFATINNRPVYRYDVEIDSEKFAAYTAEISRESNTPVNEQEARETAALLQARGEFWIDIESYHIRRVQWTLASLPAGQWGTLSLDMHIDITNHNAAPVIHLPDDATLFVQPFPSSVELPSSALLEIE